jgi:SAM-dependent methyltransferase
MSERYTHGHHESVLRTHSWRTVENSAAYLIPALREGQSLLDVGSGPGTMTVDFARRLAPGLVIGIDSAPGIVAQATRYAEREEVANVEFRVGDAYRLDFPDNSFDVVHVHQTLQHVSDPVAVLQEMWRVAKPDGVIAAREVDYAGTLWHPELPGLDAWMRVYQQVHRGNGGEPNAGRRLRSWAQAAGLTSSEYGLSMVLCLRCRTRTVGRSMGHPRFELGVCSASDRERSRDARRTAGNFPGLDGLGWCTRRLVVDASR